MFHGVPGVPLRKMERFAGLPGPKPRGSTCLFIINNRPAVKHDGKQPDSA